MARAALVWLAAGPFSWSVQLGFTNTEALRIRPFWRIEDMDSTKRRIEQERTERTEKRQERKRRSTFSVFSISFVVSHASGNYRLGTWRNDVLFLPSTSCLSRCRSGSLSSAIGMPKDAFRNPAKDPFPEEAFLRVDRFQGPSDASQPSRRRPQRTCPPLPLFTPVQNGRIQPRLCPQNARCTRILQRVKSSWTDHQVEGETPPG